MIFPNATHIHDSSYSHVFCIPITTDLTGNSIYHLATDYVCWLAVVSGMCVSTYVYKNTGGQNSILQL